MRSLRSPVHPRGRYAGSVMNILELKVPPVAVTLMVGAFMFMLSRSMDSGLVLMPFRGIVTVLLMVVGTGIALAGVAAFSRASTTVDPRYPERSSQLVTAGIFRYTRNPMYFGMLLAIGALAVYLGNVWAFLGLPAFVLYMNRFQIRPEERVMLASYGEHYRQYQSEVRRWL